jgi:hypothetical protein
MRADAGFLPTLNFRVFQQYPSISDIKSVATTFRFGLIPAVSMAAARETIYDARDPERCV